MQKFDRTKVVFKWPYMALYIFNTEVLKFRSLVNQFISNSTELKLTVRIKKILFILRNENEFRKIV